jgi:rhodanese-related sulfurtransferase
LAKAIAEGSVRLIDVRRDDEWAEGRIEGAEHIPLDQFDPASLDLSDVREVVLYCRSGRRSGIAAEQLAKHTGKPAKHLEGGILAWQEADLPVSKP